MFTLVVAGHVSLLSNLTQPLIYGIVKNPEILVCATISGSGSLRIFHGHGVPKKASDGSFMKACLLSNLLKRYLASRRYHIRILHRQIVSMLTR